MEGRILALLTMHKHTIGELALMIGEPEDGVARAVHHLYHLGRLEAYAPDGERVEPPFDSGTRFTVP